MDAFKTSSKRTEYLDFNKARKAKETTPSVDKKEDGKKGEEADDLKLGDTAESVNKEEKKAMEGLDDEGNEKLKEPPSCFPNWFRKK